MKIKLMSQKSKKCTASLKLKIIQEWMLPRCGFSIQQPKGKYTQQEKIDMYQNKNIKTLTTSQNA